jgi:cell division protein FtsW (lipid II flippase)
MVRFVFIAIATALLVAAFLAEPKQRKFMALIIFAVLLSIAAGLAARLDKAKVFADYVFEENIITGEMTRPPSCNMHVNLNNSIATRKALSADALFLIPRSGALGSGLDSFMRLSCIKNSEVHNSILQAFVEFGWLGGFSFLLLIVVSVGMLLPIARQSRGKRFLFSCLPYVILLAIVYGRISQDMLLFALLGAANGLIETSGTALVLSDT